MKVALHVIKPGSLTTVQDLGRVGVAHHGFSGGGAMDQYAMRAANALVDNPLSAPVLEITLGGVQFEVDGPVDIAVCGAEAPMQINQRYVESWRTHALEAGDVVSLGYAQRGTRLYAAFAGGIDVPLVFNSASTVVREQLGGFHGHPLMAGDAVALKPRAMSLPSRRFSVKDRYRFGGVVTLKAAKGPHWEALSRVAKRRLVAESFTLTAQSDRMGIRLQAQQPLPPLPGLLSEGLGLGTVQLPNDGHPIVLMRDHQTMGGYPKPLVLLPQAIDALAQCQSGDQVRFELLSHGQSRVEFQRYQRSLEKMPWEYV